MFQPPTSLELIEKTPQAPKKEQDEGKERKTKCPCGVRSHTLKQCFLFNAELRSESWSDRRPMFAKKKLYETMMDTKKRNQIEKELGHKVPQFLLQNPAEKTSSTLFVADDAELYENYHTESPAIFDSNISTSYMLTLTVSQVPLPYKNWWVFDSGSGRHICHQKEMFETFKPLKSNQMITTGAGDCKVEGIGAVVLVITTPKGPSTLKINGVLYVPDFMVNIISMDRIRDQMLIWDHSENWLTQWDASRTPVIKIWNQYNQNFISKEARHPYRTKIVTDIPENISVDMSLVNSTYAIKTSAVRKISCADIVVWHRRLGHINPRTIERLEKMVNGAKVTGKFDGVCEGCLLAKSKRIVSRIPSDKGESLWDRMHVDLIIFSKAYNGENYALHAYDAKGHGHLVETLASKDQGTLLKTILVMIRMLQKEGRNIRYLHSDNEKGFGSIFKELMRSEGIKFEPTVPYTPEQNGFAESSGNRICVIARAIRIHSGFPEDLWPELVRTAVYILNRTPNKALNWATPYEQYIRCKPDISNLKIVGCRAYVHIPRQKRHASDKLAERAWIGYLIGFEASNIWRIWNTISRQVVRVRDVVFQEDLLYKDDKQVTESPLDVDQISSILYPLIDDVLEPRLSRWSTIQEDSISNKPLMEIKIEPNEMKTSNTEKSVRKLDYDAKNSDDKYTIPGQFSDSKTEDEKLPMVAPRENEITADLSEQNILNEKRVRKKTKDFSALASFEPLNDFNVDVGEPFFSCLANAITTDRLDNKVDRFDTSTNLNVNQSQAHPVTNKNPSSWKQMLKHEDRTQFLIAAEAEYKGLQDRQAWKVIDFNDVPMGEKIFPMRWVFITKKDGDLIKHKARIVVRGDLDKIPYNRDEIYTHTLSLQHLRSVLSLINHHDMETLSFDAVQAFVNAKRDKPIHCYMPEGFRQAGKVLRVWQALYGHPQSPKDWFECYTSALKSLKFKSISEEKCLWIHENCIILFFYVDDSIIAFDKKYEKEAFALQEKLGNMFPIKMMGEAKTFLGIKIIRDRPKRKMWLVQENYINRISKTYNINSTKQIMTPLAVDYDMSRNEDEKLSSHLIQLYQRKVGSAIYASICTRPDIALAVSMCADHLLNPAVRHLNAITHVLQYLVNTSKYGITYNCETISPIESNSEVLLVASDASFGDNEGRRSSQGFVAFVYGGPVVWHASKQRSVTTSTTEAELVALSAAARELLALDRFLKQIVLNSTIPKKLMCDNQQTVKILTQGAPLLTTKLRHIDIHQHWQRERLRENEDKIELSWTPTSQMPADGLTKRLHISKHLEFMRQIGLQNTENCLTGSQQCA